MNRKSLLQYWREHLSGVNVLELPTDHPRPTLPTYRGDQHSFELPEELVSQLKGLSQAAGVTLHMTLLAAFQTLLSRYSGQDDIAVGVPVAGRNQTELEDLIGFFVNTLVLRTDLSEDPTFRELLGRVRQVSLAAYDHQDLPFEKLVEELRPERQLNRSPLFQVLFQLLNFADEDLALRNLDVSRLPSGSQQVRFDLEMHLWQQDKTLRGSVVYSTDLFDHSTIERMTGHFITLLEGIVAAPDHRISQLPLLTETERQLLLVEWNDTAVDYPRDKCVHELFEEQVERTPDAVAVVFEDQQLTYRELNQRANQLAHHLTALGVGPETLVGLCLERSAELVVGILGILKAGGAYVPLDVNYPPQRLEFMFTDSAIKYLVTRTALFENLPVDGLQVVCIDRAALNSRDNARLNPSTCMRSDHVAYVMYTSGSTGQPKGVVIRHRAIVRLVFGNDFASFGPDRIFLHLATPSFDASTFELWGALLHGAKLVVAHVSLPDFRQLEDLLQRNQVTTLWLTATFFNQVVEHYPQALNRVEEILTGGEALSVRHIRKAQAALGSGVQLVNGYGPTESTTFATCYQIPSDVAPEFESVPIGRPISNTQAYVLDTHRNPLPIGVPGELYIGGAGLARGYLNRPELTAEKFIANPFSSDPNARLYRTGDLCRWRADGNLEFLGRMDDQVKLRGFRIELGEIESVLNEHPNVSQSVVILREDRPGDKRLVAYCVPAKEGTLNHSDLIRQLHAKLPEYMVPSAFVLLHGVPLTASGKVNRRALPAPDDSRPDLETHYVAPATSIEQQLASIWAEVLGIDQIGIHDNFFALGGHSLLATRVVARISSALQVDLPLRKLFEAPTIAESATEIATLRSGGLIANRTALMRVDRDQIDRLPLSFAQQRLWFLEQMEGELTAYNMSSRWKLRGPLDVEALRRALEEIVQRHEPLRTTFAMLDDAPVQVIQPSGRFELPVEDLSSLAAEQQDAEILTRCRLEAEKPFNLSTDLMLRASLLHLADDEHMLLLTMHHIASDGWSLSILWRELAGLYDAYCRGAESNLRELPVQYADYAIWQRSELEGQRLEQLLQYWREQLKGVSPLELPTDHPRPALPSYRGAQHSFELPEALISQLKQLSQTSGVTLHMTLLAAFQTLLSRYSGQHDIAVGMPVAGRSHADVEDLIGFFVNTLVLRTDLSGDPTFQELLGRVRQVSLAAYDHQDLPFEKLVEELRPERQFSRSPLFQVMFQLLNFVGEGLALPNLKVSRLDMSGEGDQAFSNLDIVVALSPGADGGIIAHWTFNTALFKRETMCFLAESYRRLLEQVVEDTGTSLKHFALADARTPLYPLTLAQRDIWIDQMLHGDKPLYSIGGHVHLPGPLDIDRLRQSIQLLIQKHDSLRLQLTRSRDENGIPQQTIVPSLEVEVPLHDFRGEAEPLKAARRWMQQRFVQPFTLEGQPLFRYDVIRVADENHYWLIQYHHLIIDGWGIALLNRSLAELYTALSQGRAPDLQSPSYLDHVADYQSYLQSEQYGNHRSYWLQRYDSVPDPLLTSRTPDKGLAASDCYTVPLSRDLYQQLGILAKQYQASTFHVIIGALALYFTRTQGRDEFVIGLPVLNRSNAAFKNTAGLFTGVIPTRLQVKADASFGELLRGIAQTLRADYRRQRFPIGEINRAVKPATHHHQLYDIGLSYESHDYDAKFDAITSHSEPLLHGWEQTPLMLYVREFHAREDVQWDFVANRAYFSSQEIERLQGHLVSLLATLLTRAEMPMSQLSLLSETERHRLLVEWNDTAVDYPSEKCVHQLFEEQVERTPDAVAVIFEEQQLTYRELNERANQLAHYLISLGVGPETLVGLCLERSAELVVAILGILKAGGAYVPLDVNYPPQRLEFMLRDSGVRYLVTQSSLLDRLPSDGCCVTCLDNEAETLKASDCSNLSSGVGADNLAYVMFTSGSTGVPKGVAIPQSAVVNFLLSMSDQPGMSSDDRLLSVTTPTFDISVLELLLPLTVGASLDVVPAPLNADGIGLADYVSKRNATVMQATPATWQMMLHSGWKGCPDLKVLCGGEALSDHLADELQQRCRQLWNMYGPTETTIWSTTRLVAEEGACGSIGRPIANTQVYVLDAQRQPIPIGNPGELYIGGAGLARGYLNRPDLTGERFVANPFSSDPAARLYRTGDLCRWRADGNLEFLGRMDDQVKLRGFRIELGEIEAVLNEYPDIAQSVVVLREDRPGDKRLVAYCVTAADVELNHSELRSHLRSRLPDYMVPAAFVVLDKLPLTSSGKINRRALPAPDDSRPDLGTHYVAPGTPIEQQLASIWAEVLGIDQIGVHDNFFALGGHSLLATRVVARISSALQVDLPLRKLFEAPTIAELAGVFTAHRPLPELTTERFLSVVRPSTGCGTVICVGGGVIEMANSLSRNIGIIYLGSGTMDPVRFHQFGIEGVVDRYLAELLQARIQGPLVIVGYSYGGLVACVLTARLRLLQQERVVAILLEPSVPETRRNPARDMVARVTVYVRKLRERGLMTLYNSMRFRLKKQIQKRRSADVPNAHENPWVVIAPQIYRNIAAFRPSQRLCGDVYLVAGIAWLNKLLERFQMRLAESPCILDLGEVTHEEALNKQECIDSLISLIGEILNDRERPGVSTPDVTSGLHHVGQIPAL